MNIVEFVNQYGLPITVAGGMGYFIFFIWKFVTVQIKPKLGATFTVLVALIDRIRMLDNDLIRLDQKLNIFIEMDEEFDKRKRRDEKI
tara:strand:- start:210 stop:473 length:264 start_codon:yes stop_codon:yes gene_type:complete